MSKINLDNNLLNISFDKNEKPTRKNQNIKYDKLFCLGFRNYDISAYFILKIVGIKE